MLPQFIVPQQPSQEYLVRLVRAQYQIWREEEQARAPKWKADNIRFEHDPMWRYRMMSVQNAHDGNTLTWQVLRVVAVAAAAAPYLVSLF